MKNKVQGLTVVLGLAAVFMLAQILAGQGPAQGGGAPGQEPCRGWSRRRGPWRRGWSRWSSSGAGRTDRPYSRR